jgi:hypothetical protein
MKRRFIFPLILALLPGVFMAATWILPGPGPSPEKAIIYRTRVWSDTQPAINLTHVFAGEINRRGKAVGFHSRPGGVDPQGSGIARIVDRPNRLGVYTAVVWIGRRGRTKFSTFYPDRLTRAQVIGTILDAYRRGQRRGARFRGPSGHGFTVEGYFQNGRIHTAYPIFSR